MKRLLALAVLATSLAAQAVTVTWTRDVGIPTNARLRQVATCGDGRVYGIDATTPSGVGTLRLLNGVTGAVTAAMGNDSISCVNNVLHLYRRSTRELVRNDGSALGAPNVHVGTAPFGTDRVTGSMVLALFIPVPTFVALTTDRRVLLSTSPESSWTQVGAAAGAEQIVVGGGFLEHRLYAQNVDDALFENVGQGCNEYWRLMSPGGLRSDRPTVRAVASSGIGNLTVLDDTGAVFHGAIAHERAAVVLDAGDFATLNAVVRGSQFHVDGLGATFTPSFLLSRTGVPTTSFELPAIDLSLPLGNTRYSPHDINLAAGTALSLTPSGRSVIFSARFEEEGLELLSSNGLYPNMNVSSLSGTVTFGGKVGMCGQPEVTASAATFNGNFSGVDNLFSFIVDILNGDIRNGVQAAMLSGVQQALQQRDVQLAIQMMLLDTANLVSPPAATGAQWNYIVGNTFSVTGSTVKFTVER